MTAANGLRQLIDALRKTGVRFLAGGSVASSVRGIPRSTLDVDMVCDLKPDQAQAFCRHLGNNWYADDVAIQSATQRGTSFNVIFIPRSFKFDLFPATTDFHRAQLERATSVEVTLEGESVICPVARAEDIILAKLLWLREMGGTSERQETDIRGVLCANDELDWEYIDSWAAKLGVTELLGRFTEPPTGASGALTSS